MTLTTQTQSSSVVWLALSNRLNVEAEICDGRNVYVLDVTWDGFGQVDAAARVAIDPKTNILPLLLAYRFGVQV